MYRLIKFKATNVAGFVSGMNQKTVEIDLEEFSEKDIICIIGDNGVGKSTFLSLVHPWNVPMNGKSKFIVKGKEGLLVRTYLGEDGTVIVSKCIYKPKKDGGHSASCYLEVTKPGCDPVEVNPNGNVSSYQGLLYAYFGITKDYLTFATYSTEIANIVKMTDTERKSSVGTLVPNTKRFEVAFDIINDKYKNLRNMIRNIAQKILSLRDEDALEADSERLNSEMCRYAKEREDRIKKLAKAEGRLKEITRGTDVDEMISKYNTMVASLAGYDSEITKVYKKLMKLYGKLDIEVDKPGSINFPQINQVSSYIMRYEKKISSSEATTAGYVQRMNQLRDELHRVERSITETESTLYSIQASDVSELIKTRENYERQLKSLRYTKVKDQYENMNYDEVVNFSRTVSMIDSMIHALYDQYGELVPQFFSQDPSLWKDMQVLIQRNMEATSAELEMMTAQREQLLLSIAEKEQYRKFEAILQQRPATCTIDDCPFIEKALRWNNVAQELKTLNERYATITNGIDQTRKLQEENSEEMGMYHDGQKLIEYLSANEPLIRKYFELDSLTPLYKAIANGTWNDILDIMRLKEIASILSEKQLYLQITQMSIPEVDHAIEMAKVYGTNRDLLLHQLEQFQSTRKILLDQLNEYAMHIKIGQEQCSRYKTQLSLWKETSENIERYQTLVANQLETKQEADKQDSTIRKIKELMDKCKSEKHIIDELDELIRVRSPQLERTRMDLEAVRRLKIEQLEVEREFTVIEIIRSITAPGKGVRKELINIYMYDICTIANQLLLNTFGGKLYLKEFIITDKEFIIPYVYNGSEGSDIAYASSAQQSTIASAISLAILSKLMDRYGIYTADEQDAALNPKNKSNFIQILTSQMKMVGITQAFIITQEPSYYVPHDPGFLIFPGGEVNGKHLDTIYI